MITQNNNIIKNKTCKKLTTMKSKVIQISSSFTTTLKLYNQILYLGSGFSNHITGNKNLF